MKRLIVFSSPMLAALVLAAGPTVGGWGMGGNPRNAGALAFFEFAPSNGAGMGVACSPPNWAPYSEQIDNVAWGKSSVGVAVPTVTANQAIAPNGTLTADRVQFAATNAGQESVINLSNVCPNPSQCIAGIWVLGNGASGTLDIGIRATSGTTCNYNASTWVLCTTPATSVTGAHSLNIGNDTFYSSTSRSAQDVFVWGGQVNTASALGAYVLTVGTVPLGPSISGAKGEPVSFTRASTATCTKTVGGFEATTGIANGDIITIASNQPIVEQMSNGLNLGREESRTNNALRSSEFDNAAWSLGTATITGNYAVAPDGTTTADRFQYTAVNGSWIFQNWNVGGLAAVVSVYLKGTSSSGAVDLCRGGGTPQCVVCNYVSTSWSRCVLAANFASSTNFFIGCDTPTKGSACSAAGDVLLWGAQAELGVGVTSYIPTTSAAVTRAADNATVALSLAMGTASMSFTSGSAVPSALGTPDRIGIMPRVLSGSGDYLALYFQAQARADAVGSASNSATSGGTAAADDRFALSWDGTNMTIFKNGTQTSTNALASTLGTATVVGLGGSPAGASIFQGHISKLCIDQSTARCR